jgi:sugar (pentulose or hexulose) kinase
MIRCKNIRNTEFERRNVMYVIGVDLGTQSMKGFLVDAQGKFVAESSAAYDPVYPFPAWTEENPADWIHAFKKIVKELLDTSGVNPAEIGTIGLDAINDTVVAIDKLHLYSSNHSPQA